MAILVLELLLPAFSQNRVALTFEDLPARGPMGYWRPREISNMVLKTLEKHGIKAAGFVVQEKIDDEPMLGIVPEDWAKAGHILGNQTYSRVDYNELGTEDLLEHLRDGQKLTRYLSRLYPFNYHYVRFPLLHQGNTKRKRKDIQGILERADYQIAHVTVKTSDHEFIRPLLDHFDDPAAVDKLKGFYLAHVSESFDYAESQSKAVFGRGIAHILQLRCAISTAFFLDDLIELLKRRGYEFVGLPEALSDPAYKTKEMFVTPYGLSFIDRVAAERSLSYENEQGELKRGDVESWLKGSR